MHNNVKHESQILYVPYPGSCLEVDMENIQLRKSTKAEYFSPSHWIEAHSEPNLFPLSSVG